MPSPSPAHVGGDAECGDELPAELARVLGYSRQRRRLPAHQGGGPTADPLPSPPPQCGGHLDLDRAITGKCRLPGAPQERWNQKYFLWLNVTATG